MRRTLRSLAGDLEIADRPLVIAVGVMLIVGLIVVYGAGSYTRLAQHTLLTQHRPLIKHVGMILMGLGVLVAAMRVDYRWLRHPAVCFPVFAETLSLTSAARAFPNIGAGGVDLPRRWIFIGGFGLQPAEFAKIALIMLLAARLAPQRTGEKVTPRQLLATLAVGPGLLMAVLFVQPNFGNMLVVAIITGTILMITRVADRVLLLLGAAAVPVVAAGYLLIDKVQNRVNHLVAGWTEGRYDWQQMQSLVSIAANGAQGAGPGQGQNKLAFLAEAHTDFIFASLSEEWGLAGALLVISMFVLLVWRGYGIATRAADPYGRTLAAGLTTGIAAYGFINIAMTMGLMPVIGVPLPLVSSGGTTILATLAAVGILLNVERNSRSEQVWKRRWQRGAAA